MEEIFRYIDRMKDYVMSQNMYELFIATSHFKYIECSKETTEFQEKESEGMSSRFFNKEKTEFRNIDGISFEKLDTMSKNSYPSYYLPASKIISPTSNNNAVALSFDDYKNKSVEMDEAFCENIWNKVSKICKKNNEELHKFYFQYHWEHYVILNSMGVEGYSVRSLSVFGFEKGLQNSFCSKVIPQYRSLTDSEMNQLILGGNDIKKGRYKNPSYILFTDMALTQVIFILLFLLNATSVIVGNSRFSYNDIGKRLFSEKFTLNENSVENIVIMGSTDGEGTPRKSTPIIERGILKHFISDYEHGNAVGGTGSSYRFSHRVPPMVQLSKARISGQLSTDQIYEKYDNIMIIDNIIGISESFNPITTGLRAMERLEFTRKVTF